VNNDVRNIWYLNGQNLFFQRTLVLLFWGTHCTQDSNFRVVQRNFMNWMGISLMSMFVILVDYVAS
jgi:hypothetical protein